LIIADQVTELGDVLINPGKGRNSDAEITIANLTGLAAQDIAMAQLVMTAREGVSLLFSNLSETLMYGFPPACRVAVIVQSHHAFSGCAPSFWNCQTHRENRPPGTRPPDQWFQPIFNGATVFLERNNAIKQFFWSMSAPYTRPIVELGR
jgi:hypothetical protein